MNKISIMHLIPKIRDRDGIYGAEKVLLTVSNKVDKSRFRTIVVSLSDVNPKLPVLLCEAQKKGISTDIIYMKGRFDLRAIFKVRRLLDKYSIDILHCHTYKADIIGLLASRFKKVHIVTTLHGWTASNTKIKIYELLEVFATSFFDKIIVVAECIKGKLFKRRGVDKKVTVIPNGVDANKPLKEVNIEKIKEELNIKPQSQIIGSIGRLSREKGYRYLLDAIVQIKDRFPNIVFVLIGDGPDEENLKDYTKKLEISNRVIFLGYQNYIDKFLAMMEIFILPSLRESFGLVILEAMVAGKPVVATSVGGIPFLVENMKTGVLVPPKDPLALANAIVKLLEDKEEAKKMGLAGRKRVEEKFSADAMVKIYEGIYINLMKG